MKSTLFLTAATLFVTAASAQQTDSTSQNGTTDSTTGSTNQTGTMGNTMSTTDSSKKLNAYGSYSTRDSIAAKYKLLPMPGGLTVDKTFPILGMYQLNTVPAAGSMETSTTTSTTAQTDGTATSTDASATGTTGMAAPGVTITLDSASKGIVWVDGLQQGRMKAFLKKSPATYRIVAQKSATGTAIPEGTMHLDQATNTLHIALGTPYNEMDPTAIFGQGNGTTAEDNTADTKVKTKNTKTKSKVTFITATKVIADPMQNGQMQQGTTNGTMQQNNQQQ